MPESEDEQMLTVWGIGEKLRRGILIAIITLLAVAIAKLYVDKSNQEARFQQQLTDQNERLLKILIPSIEKVNQTVSTVDTLAKKADSTLTVLNQVK